MLHLSPHRAPSYPSAQLKVQIETPPVLPSQSVEDEGLSDSERRLAKGMSRRTMCGPPLLDHIKDKVDMAALMVSGGAGA